MEVNVYPMPYEAKDADLYGPGNNASSGMKSCPRCSLS